MNFEKALTAMREGKKLIRDAWKSQRNWLGTISYVSFYTKEGSQNASLFIKMSDRKLEAEWSPEQEDVLAEDWEIVS